MRRDVGIVNVDLGAVQLEGPAIESLDELAQPLLSLTLAPRARLLGDLEDGLDAGPDSVLRLWRQVAPPDMPGTKGGVVALPKADCRLLDQLFAFVRIVQCGYALS
jgi:hypothetical protein